MSQDANQGDGDNTPPSNQQPYSDNTPPSNQQPYSDNTPPSNQQPYDSPPPSQNPYGPPPTNYGAPQNPYEPPQNPYGAPQNPYNPPGYGAPPPGTEAAFSGPIGNQVRLRPLPLNEAIRQLPGQYIRVLTKPGASTFAEELPKSSWDITLIQILIMVVVAIVLGLIRAAIASATTNATLSSVGLSSANLQNFSSLIYATSFGSVFLNIISVPLTFFIGVGILFLLAKAFHGEGTFLTQSYTSLLYQVPLYIINLLFSLLGVIPIAGGIIVGLVSLVVFIYSIVLNVYQIMAVHRLSGGKATWVVLIPYIILFVLLLLCGIVAGAVIVSTIKNMS